MSDRFKNLFEEARNSNVDPDWVDKFEEAFEASPLRQEIKETKSKYQQALEANSKFRDTILTERFKEAGITISPKALRVPDDLDPTDGEKVNGWLQEMGLAKPTPTTPPEELAAHDRIAAAGNSEGQPSISLDDLDPSKMTEEEYYAKAEALSQQLRK